MGNHGVDCRDDLLDISDLSCADLGLLAGSALGQAVAEALKPVLEGEPYAEFNSSMPTRAH